MKKLGCYVQKGEKAPFKHLDETMEKRDGRREEGEMTQPLTDADSVRD